MDSEDYQFNEMNSTRIPEKAKIARTLLFLCNMIFFCFGCILLSVGLYVQLDHGFVSEIIGSALYLSAAYMSMVAGLSIMFIAFLGCWCALRQRKGEMIAYLIFCLIVALVTICAVVSALLFKATLAANARSSMLYSLQRQFGKKRLITEAWILTQSKLRCCGVDSNGWTAYNNSEWDLMTNADERNKNSKIPQMSPLYKFVPESCCLALIDPRTMWPSDTLRDVRQCQYWPYGPPNRLSGGFNDALYYRGCFDAGAEFVSSHGRFFAGFGIFLFIVLLCGIACSFVMVANVTPTMLTARKSAGKVHFNSPTSRPLLANYE